MKCKTAFIYSEKYSLYNFGSNHPFKPYRWNLTLNILKNLNVFKMNNVKLVEVKRFNENILELVHTRKYIEYIKKRCKENHGYLDYGDTPARRGVFEGCLTRVLGNIEAIDLLLKDNFDHAFNFGGGLHHAGPNYASGFCVFNDIAIAVRYLQKKYGYNRIAIIDI
ncbi:MAG TPA: acetoin utilization protein AcuC, partial [Thermoprotei archaeon]|nr:acetoin utilization protein AcuC [Thermoprotei archaeon]